MNTERSQWELPGGAAEENESLEGTAIREGLEETGLVVVVDRMVGRIYYDPNYDMHHFVFRCHLVKDHAGADAYSPEISEWCYFQIGALPRPIRDFTIRRIQDAIAQCEPGMVERDR